MCVVEEREAYQEDGAEIVYAGEFSSQGDGFSVLSCWGGRHGVWQAEVQPDAGHDDDWRLEPEERSLHQ